MDASLYQLKQDDVLLLKHVVEVLREQQENSTANDLELLVRRVEHNLTERYMLTK